MNSKNNLENLLKEHVKILKKKELNDKDISLLLNTLKDIQESLKELIKDNNEFKDNLENVKKMIDEIIYLANKHKRKIFNELSKYNIKQKAFYSYNIQNPNLKSFNKKI